LPFLLNDDIDHRRGIKIVASYLREKNKIDFSRTRKDHTNSIQ
jgi:hypothetical protein